MIASSLTNKGVVIDGALRSTIDATSNWPGTRYTTNNTLISYNETKMRFEAALLLICPM